MIKMNSNYDETTKNQAGILYHLFPEFFGGTEAFRQANSHIYSLLAGNLPTLHGKVFTPEELEKSIPKAKGLNKDDAWNFFGPAALFKRHLRDEISQLGGVGLNQKLYDATSKIINFYQLNGVDMSWNYLEHLDLESELTLQQRSKIWVRAAQWLESHHGEELQ